MKASELKKGMIIKDGKDFMIVVDVEHRTPGNLRAIYQTTLKNLLTGRIANKRFSPSDAVENADLESKTGQYLFRDHVGYHFMCMDTYETLTISEEMVGHSRDYLKENIEVTILYYAHNPVTIELPVNVTLKVTEAGPAYRGDTTGKAMKPAKLETGISVNVPLFIEEGDVVRIDTRTGNYLERVSQ